MKCHHTNFYLNILREEDVPFNNVVDKVMNSLNHSPDGNDQYFKLGCGEKTSDVHYISKFMKEIIHIIRPQMRQLKLKITDNYFFEDKIINVSFQFFKFFNKLTCNNQ